MSELLYSHRVRITNFAEVQRGVCVFSAGCAAFPELLPCKARFRGERRVMILFLLVGLCVCAARDDHRCSVLLASAETAMTYALITVAQLGVSRSVRSRRVFLVAALIF